MKLYHLEFERGSYDDYSISYLGCYSSAQKRDEAKGRYRNFKCNRIHIFEEDGEGEGRYIEREAELDVDEFAEQMIIAKNTN